MEARQEEGEQTFAWIAGRLEAAGPAGGLWRLRSKALSRQGYFAFAREGQGVLTDDEAAHACSRQLVEEALQCAQEEKRAGEEARLDKAPASRRLTMCLSRTLLAERAAIERRAPALALEAEDDEGIGVSLVRLGEFLRYLDRASRCRTSYTRWRLASATWGGTRRRAPTPRRVCA